MRVDPKASTEQCLVFSGDALSLEIEATNVKHNREASLVPCRLQPRRHRAKALYNLCDGIAINLQILKTRESQLHSASSASSIASFTSASATQSFASASASISASASASASASVATAGATATSVQSPMKLIEWSRFSTIALDLRICIKVSGITRFQAMCRVNGSNKYRKEKRKRECSGSDDCSDSNYYSDGSTALKRSAISSSPGAGAKKGKDKEIAYLLRKIARMQHKIEALSEENLMLVSENEMHRQQQSALIRAAGEERSQMGLDADLLCSDGLLDSGLGTSGEWVQSDAPADTEY